MDGDYTDNLRRKREKSEHLKDEVQVVSNVKDCGWQHMC
jgi:hypothetical protein